MGAYSSTLREFFALNNLHWAWAAYWGTYVLGALTFPQVQVETNEPLTRKEVAQNLLFHGSMTFFWPFLFDKVAPLVTRVNTWTNFLGVYSFLFFLSDISVYVTHRLLHTRWFYQFHKTHHTYIHAEPLGAVYESVVEMLAGSPLLVMPLYRNLAMTTPEIVVMSIIYALNSLRIHSGVAWSVTGTDTISTVKKWVFDDSFHAAHHLTRRYNYGLSGLSDWVMGTYTNGSKAIEAARAKSLIRTDRLLSV